MCSEPPPRKRITDRTGDPASFNDCTTALLKWSGTLSTKIRDTIAVGKEGGSLRTNSVSAVFEWVSGLSTPSKP